MILSLYNVSITLFARFLKKIRKFLPLEKLENLKNYFKKRLDPFKTHLQQKWRAEKMSVVAGRLVSQAVNL